MEHAYTGILGLIARPWMRATAVVLITTCHDPLTQPKVVSVTIPVMNITPRSTTLHVGETMSFVATPPSEFAGQPLRWTVSDTTRLLVDQAGHVTGRAEGQGSVVVTVVSEPSVAALATVTIIR